MKIDITKDGEVIKTIDFPEHPREVSLSKYIDFDYAVKELFTEIKDTMTNQEIGRLVLTEKYHAKRAKQILKIVSEFLDVDEGILITGEIGEINQKMLYKQRGTLISLLANIVLIVYTYTPPIMVDEDHKHTFKYKGDTWELPYFTKSFQVHLAKEGLLNPLLRTGDVIEINESIRVLEDQKKKDGDTASFEWMKYLSILSVLAKKEGEKLPGTLTTIRRRKEQRMKYFEDIDMVTGLNADFFLGCTINI